MLCEWRTVKCVTQINVLLPFMARNAKIVRSHISAIICCIHVYESNFNEPTDRLFS